MRHQECKSQNANAAMGKAKICSHRVSYLGLEYCPDCSLKFKSCEVCGKELADTEVDVEEYRTLVDGLVANGQAKEVGEDGKLPAGATHQIVGHWTDGTPVVKRIRFS